MTAYFGDLARNAGQDGFISADEILQLRRAGWGDDGKITRAEAEAIFAADHANTMPTGAWTDFMVEAIGEFVINGTEPRNYVSDEEAEWLIAQLDGDGRFCTMTELELLVRILERAFNIPETLKAYVLARIEEAVLHGEGPTRQGGSLNPSGITAVEAEILRRVIFSSGGDRPGAVGRREAEMLFRLKEATANADNATEWKDVFVRGVGSYLLGFSGPSAQISRERALELEAFMADGRHGVGRFMGSLLKALPGSFGNLGAGVGEAVDSVFDRDRMAERRARHLAGQQTLDAAEQGWLERAIAADGKIDAYESALLDFIMAEQESGPKA
ncbi:hypothetical protein [Qipengyuania sp. JC766]|uniref:hypothetical protein n=1 Tax=Qipengyuania sp. JC766 TaxID=3232139 RepID=UPI0034589647